MIILFYCFLQDRIFELNFSDFQEIQYLNYKPTQP